MEASVLIHGYSAEGDSKGSMDAIYGGLPAALNAMFAADPPVVGINVSRYISLDDGVTLDGLSLSFDRAVRAKYPKL